MASRVEDHSANPQKDGTNPIYHTALTERQQRGVPHRIKQVLKGHAGEVVGDANIVQPIMADPNIIMGLFQNHTTGINMNNKNRL
jgi:hypothetical protein